MPMTDPTEIVDAGPFAAWLEAMRDVLRGRRDADVPCGSCVGCCASSYPIPLRAEDRVARDEVPEQWLIGPARPGERWLMGFREDGSCPFLEQRQCSIYAHRPQTCRDYDCRIYAAAGLLPDGGRPVIRQRVLAWRFSLDSPADRRGADAVRRAAQFIQRHADLFPEGARAHAATAAAVMAVKAWELFDEPRDDEPPAQLAGRVIRACQAFDDPSPALPGTPARHQ